MAYSLKLNETRSFYTAYRGFLIIHSSKTFGVEEKPYARRFWPVMQRYACMEGCSDVTDDNKPVESPDDLPLGRALAIVELVDCVQIRAARVKVRGRFVPPEDDDPEAQYGNYAEGRYAWMTTGNLIRFSSVIKAKGAQGLWIPDDDLRANILRRLPATEADPWINRLRSSLKNAGGGLI